MGLMVNRSSNRWLFNSNVGIFKFATPVSRNGLRSAEYCTKNNGSVFGEWQRKGVKKPTPSGYKHHV